MFWVQLLQMGFPPAGHIPQHVVPRLPHSFLQLVLGDGEQCGIVMWLVVTHSAPTTGKPHPLRENAGNDSSLMQERIFSDLSLPKGCVGKRFLHSLSFTNA